MMQSFEHHGSVATNRWVAALFGLILSLVFSPLTVLSSPAAPRTVWVSPGDASNVIRWQAVPGASGYHVKYSSRRSGTMQTVAENVSGSEWLHEGIRNRGRSYYAVSAIDASGESADSPRLLTTPSEPVLDWLPSGASVEKLAGGLNFTEGPVWNPANGGFLIFSDINANRLYSWSPSSGLDIFRTPSQNANGNTIDLEGRLITCEHTTRRVTRTAFDGTITPIIETHEGQRFNSPNDVVVKSDGTIWFTDPTWGLSGRKELDGQYVFRFDPTTAITTLVARGFQQPNGLCFSPDESILYVAESAGPVNVRAFDVQANGTLTGDRIFANPSGTPDGMRVDSQGRLFTTAEDVYIYDPNGSQIGRIDVPEVPANLCFGGENDEMLFITARTSLYGITRRPDLVVESIQTIPENPEHGDRVTFQVILSNEGTGATPRDVPIEVTFLVGTSPTYILPVSFHEPLAPGASLLLETDPDDPKGVWSATFGSHRLEAIVDIGQSIEEVSSDNNSRNLSLFVERGILLRAARNAENGAAQLHLVGSPGERFLLQSSPDLNQWTDWMEIEIGPGQTAVVINAPTALETFKTFYRAVTP